MEFPDSGRAMILMNGLSQEKQNTTVDPDEAHKLKNVMDSLVQESESAVWANGFNRT